MPFAGVGPVSSKMNPFSKYLRQWTTDANFDTFVDDWDRLESLVISVYRGRLSENDSAAEFSKIWPILRTEYPKWKEILRPYWKDVLAGGKPVGADPFRTLLAMTGPADISGNWEAMQILPAAREAINRYLANR